MVGCLGSLTNQPRSQSPPGHIRQGNELEKSPVWVSDLFLLGSSNGKRKFDELGRVESGTVNSAHFPERRKFLVMKAPNGRSACFMLKQGKVDLDSAIKTQMKIPFFTVF